MPVRRVIMLVFVFSGFCAAVAAIIYSARLGGGRPTIGAGAVLLDIIGATVIGGTSLAGGKGKVSWTFDRRRLLRPARQHAELHGPLGLLHRRREGRHHPRRRRARRRPHAPAGAARLGDERRDPRALEGISKAFAGIHARPRRQPVARPRAHRSAWSARTAPARAR